MFNKNFISIIILAILFSMFPLYAKNDSGKNLLLLGDSASSLGRGGAGVSMSGADLFYINPASVGAAERLQFGLQYGTLGFWYHNPDVTFAMPTSYGVLGASFRMINIPSDSNDIESGYSFSVGGAKNFTDRLIMGAAVNFFTGSDYEGSLEYVGLTIGSIYRIDYNKKIKKGFGIFEPKAGLSLNTGLAYGDNNESANFNQVTLGYNFLFYKDKKFNVKLSNDFSSINGYKNFPVKIGFESVIKKKYIARTGFTAPQSYEYGDYTIGLGYKFKADDFDGDINYSLVHYSEWSYVHYLGLNIKYGKLDREAPETKIATNEIYISPNYDGKQDFLIFSPEVEDESIIKGWKLQILNSNNDPVQEYRISERDIDEGLSLKGFIMKIWQRKESMVIPANILWDGADLNRKDVPDGRYMYSFVAWDERENISVAKKGIICVDNTPPKVTLKGKQVLFSPNGDNQKDTLNIKQEIITSTEDEWKAGFMDSKGSIVKSYNWAGSVIPSDIVWNGKDDNGADVPEGLYSYFVESTDKAGNSGLDVKKQISLTRQYQVADVTSSHEYYSYNKDKDMNFYLDLSNLTGLQEWKITIEDDDGDILKEIKGNKTLPEFVKWKALDSGNNKLDDGKYFFKLSTKFDSGNTPSSFKKEVIIDSAPPKIMLSYAPDLFSPDEDGENDILTIYPEAEDKTGIKNWNLKIYAPSGKVFKSFNSESNPPEEIKWDGIGKHKDLVESAADYYMELNATDTAGNKAKTERIKLPIDVLVVVTERGLKIRISNIEFGFDKAELRGKAFPILNRVTELLEKYKRYTVLIEGHTDDIGKEEYNLKLSEARAKSVMDYLITKGLDEERLTFRGMGETAPFLPNSDKENRRRNRRVEFLLIKESKNW